MIKDKRYCKINKMILILFCFLLMNNTFSYADQCIGNSDIATLSERLVKLFLDINPKILADNSTDKDIYNPEKISVTEDQYPLVKSNTAAKNTITLSNSFFIKTFKDGGDAYLATPLALSISTGNNTEIDLSSDFLTYTNPVMAFNDTTVGFKWNFRSANPSMALVGSMTVPTAGASIGTPCVEPGLTYSCDFSLGSKFDFSINLGMTSVALYADQDVSVSYNHRVRRQKKVYNKGKWIKREEIASEERQKIKDFLGLSYFYQGSYSCELDYHINPKSTLSLAFGTTCPNTYPYGVDITQMTLGYAISPKPNLQYNFYFEKGLSCIDVDWALTMAVSRTF